MEIEVVESQGHLCKYCGAQKVLGAAVEAVGHPSVYLECPNRELHTEDMVPFEQLEHGVYYYGSCRNATFARWNAETKQFVYMREKFRSVFPEEIGYWVEAKPWEHRFDEFKPYGKLETPLFEIPMTAR